MNESNLISRILRGICFFPKTIYINFKILPIIQAIKLPIIIMSSSHLVGINKQNVKIHGKIKTGMIQFGAKKTSKRGIPIFNKTNLIVTNNGKIIFNGNTSIGAGTSICAKGGEIEFGDDFSCNVNCFIYSQKKITFNNDVLLGWNINIRDNDGHPIYNIKNEQINNDKSISIGNHVWISSYVDILKGINLADGIIVGTRSLVTKSIDEKNCLIAGVPAKIKKSNVFWKH